MTSSNISNVAVGFTTNTNVAVNMDASKKAGKDQPAFANLMSQSAKPNVSVSVNNLGAQSQKQQDSTPANAGKTTAGDTSNIKKVSDKALTIKDKVMDSKDTVTNEIKDVVKEDLSVTDEQLENAMSQLGLTALDLLNPANLAQLTAQLTGSTDTSELLMSNNFLNMMQQIGEIGQKLADSIGVSVQDLQAVVQQMSTSKQGQFEIPSEMTPVQTDSTNQSATTTKAEVVPENPIKDVASQQTDATTTTADKQGVVQVQNIDQKGNSDAKQTDALQTTVSDKQVKEPSTESDASSNSSMDNTTGKDDQSELLFQKSNQHTQDTNYAEILAHNVNQTVNTAEQILTPIPNVPTYTTSVNVTDIINQIADFAKISASPEKTSIEMQLNPENLGKVYLQISSTKEGNVTAQLAAQSVAVKEALESQVADLRQTLNQQGIKVDAIEVTVATHEFEQNLDQNGFMQQQQNSGNQRQSSGRRSLHADSLDELSGLMTEEEVLAARIMKDNGNSMDVTA